MTLARRLDENPLILPGDVTPSLPELEVVSVFNAAAARVSDEIVLLLRVAERPRGDIVPPPGAMTLDLSRPSLPPRPLEPGLRAEDVVGLAYFDTQARPPRIAVAYVRRDTPGLDLSDRRTIRFANPDSAAGVVFGSEDYLAQISHLRVARSRDGIHFTVDPRPAIAPSRLLEEYGVEDPRATQIDGVWHITYVSVSRLGITTSRATTVDFRTFEHKGVMLYPDQKDVVLFPERIGGRYAVLTRPMPQSFARVFGIWIAFSDDLVSWGGHVPLALPRWGQWDELRTGAGTVPIRTRDGWLALYHGVDRTSRYAMGGLLLDLADPRRVLARSKAPILVPEAAFEVHGLNERTVFACGHVSLDNADRRIRLYYGAADSVIGAADLDVDEILASLAPVAEEPELVLD